MEPAKRSGRVAQPLADEHRDQLAVWDVDLLDQRPEGPERVVGGGERQQDRAASGVGRERTWAPSRQGRAHLASGAARWRRPVGHAPNRSPWGPRALRSHSVLAGLVRRARLVSSAGWRPAPATPSAPACSPPPRAPGRGAPSKNGSQAGLVDVGHAQLGRPWRASSPRLGRRPPTRSFSRRCRSPCRRPPRSAPWPGDGSASSNVPVSTTVTPASGASASAATATRSVGRRSRLRPATRRPSTVAWLAGSWNQADDALGHDRADAVDGLQGLALGRRQRAERLVVGHQLARDRLADVADPEPEQQPGEGPASWTPPGRPAGCRPSCP